MMFSSSSYSAVVAILAKYAEDPLPAAFVAVGVIVVMKFAFGVS
jgi:hypothetical protein